MDTDTDLTSDHGRRLLNQRAFPHYYVNCPCQRGCPLCAHTRLISKAQAQELGHQDLASNSPRVIDRASADGQEVSVRRCDPSHRNGKLVELWTGDKAGLR